MGASLCLTCQHYSSCNSWQPDSHWPLAVGLHYIGPLQRVCITFSSAPCSGLALQLAPVYRTDAAATLTGQLLCLSNNDVEGQDRILDDMMAIYRQQASSRSHGLSSLSGLPVSCLPMISFSVERTMICLPMSCLPFPSDRSSRELSSLSSRGEQSSL